jgi:hypothetical protein
MASINEGGWQMIRRFLPTMIAVVAAIFALTGTANATTGAAGHTTAGAMPVLLHVDPAHAKRSALQPHTCYAVAAHFLARYSEDQTGWGCATTPEYTYLNGTYQEFVNGEMDWSPSQGGNMVVSGMKAAGGIWFRWGFSDPFNYDAWLLRGTHDGVTDTQFECSAGQNFYDGYCTRTSGGKNIALGGPGHYQIIVEGCDVGLSHTCRQGWTIPVDLWY